LRRCWPGIHWAIRRAAEDDGASDKSRSFAYCGWLDALIGFERKRRISPELERPIVIRQMLEANMLPKFHSGDVEIHNENIAFLYSLLGERNQTFLHEEQCYALFAELLLYREVTHNTAPTIVATQHGSDQRVPNKRNEAEASISIEVQCYAFPIVVLDKAHPFRFDPKTMDLFIVR
jgi:hypothetical protein